MRINRSVLLALLATVALHLLALATASLWRGHVRPAAPVPAADPTLTLYTTAPAPRPPHPVPPRTPQAQPAPVERETPPARQPASMAAPPPPSAEEWALAAKYTPRNSKRYRYNWGQQVRSMMGTAVEGPDQGIVRFRVEIAPDGRLASLETLWSTSARAEQLAREAIRQMPPLPPTPTGKPLFFEQTISFQPFDAGWPPIYKNDCLPEPPKFRNPFVWDGKSAMGTVRSTPPPDPQDPAALEECLRNLPQDSLEAESADAERQLKQWGSSELAPRR